MRESVQSMWTLSFEKANRFFVVLLLCGCSFSEEDFPAFLISRLAFCGATIVNDFFCDIDSWLALFCTETHLIEMVNITLSFIVILGSFVVTLVSYIYIISTVLQIPSPQHQQKAFFTCSAHLTVMVKWYSCSTFLYIQPSKQNSLNMNKLVTLLNTVTTPLLNPFIYMLRNKEIKDNLRKAFSSS